MQIIIYGDGSYWLFTGTGQTQMLAIGNAVNRAETFVQDFVIKTAYEPRYEHFRA